MNTGGYVGNACILTQLTGSVINLGFGYISGANPAGFFFFAGGMKQGNAVTLTLNVWTNIQITWDVTNMSTYVNGSLLGTTTPGGTASNNGSAFRIGRRWDLSEYVTGVIGNVKIYSRALIQSEVTQDYTTTAGTYA